MRFDKRRPNELRPIQVQTGFLAAPPGSCLISMGKTRVVCSAMVEESVPPFLKGSGKGWLTAEYSMLPASSRQRITRERAKIGGRTHEIQRLIGRSLRNCVDLKLLGERSILVDCDVLDADGGTRTAAITGSYIAVMLALKTLAQKTPEFKHVPKMAVAAISVGMVKGQAVLDLNYEEDKDAEVDMNVVKTSTNKYVEVQGTAEGQPFEESAMNEMLALATHGISELFQVQKKALENWPN